ncbi:MAG: MFS transporter [Gemmataceae bacterium]|nr:MFS transporter [Gemmataceae bacterium]
MTSTDDRLSPRQWLLLFILAAVQFTHIIDFMLAMPLSKQLMADLRLDADRFGWVMSSYGFSACVAGFVLASVVDRFDRRSALAFLFGGFTLSTLLCAWAPSYEWLLAGRIAAGAFGGVAGAVVLSIIGDAYPLSRRGTATGVVFSAFSIATIVGIPASIALAGTEPAGWRTPFLVLGLLSLGLLPVLWLVVPNLRGHIVSRVERYPLLLVATRPAHLRAFLFMFVLNLSSWTVLPFLPAFLQNNVGLTSFHLQLMYAIGGVGTLLSTNLAGRLSDRFSRWTVFQVTAALAIVPLAGLPLLPAVAPIVGVLALTTALMVLTSARGVPAFALLTAVPSNAERGAFLSVNSSVLQLAMACGPVLAGLFLKGGEDGAPLVGYEKVGAMSAVFGVASVLMIHLISAGPKPAPAPEPDEAIREPAEGVRA